MFSQVVLKCPVSSSAFPWLDAGDARGHTGSVREGGPVPGCPHPTQVWEKGEDRQMGSQDLCSWACGPRVPILLIQENCSLSYVHDIVGFCLQRGCRNARKPHSAGGDHLPLLLTAPNFWEWCWAPTHRQPKSSPACAHSSPHPRPHRFQEHWSQNEDTCASENEGKRDPPAQPYGNLEKPGFAPGEAAYLVLPMICVLGSWTSSYMWEPFPRRPQC